MYISPGRSDRSGSQVHDLIFAMAYCYKNDLPYKGAIVDRRDVDITTKLIKILDLPPPIRKSVNDRLLNPEIYRNKDQLHCSDTFLQKLRSNYNHKEQPKDSISIAVHIRRGDVLPGMVPNRYLFNDYYLQLLNKIKQCCPMNLIVNIFSESRSHESLDVFKDIESVHCDIHLDTPLDTVWEAVINADICIMSRSSFSYVPALYNKNIVLYHPFWHNKQDSWLDTKHEDFDNQLRGRLQDYINKNKTNCDPIP
jgi:hypothetical protein